MEDSRWKMRDGKWKKAFWIHWITCFLLKELQWHPSYVEEVLRIIYTLPSSSWTWKRLLCFWKDIWMDNCVNAFFSNWKRLLSPFYSVLLKETSIEHLLSDHYCAKQTNFFTKHLSIHFGLKGLILHQYVPSNIFK